MAYKGKIQLTFIIVAPPDQVEEGDRLFRSHAPWMEATHHRDGDKALLSYNVSKVAELSDPMNPNSAATGNTCYVLSEIYETEGLRRHARRIALPDGEGRQPAGGAAHSCHPKLLRGVEG